MTVTVPTECFCFSFSHWKMLICQNVAAPWEQNDFNEVLWKPGKLAAVPVSKISFLGSFLKLSYVSCCLFT